MARILIVDDAAFMRLVLKKILVTSGHEVVGEATDGDTAIRMFRKLEPDLITLDVTMPGRDSIEVLREILSIDPDALVLMCSGLGQQARVVESLRIGARDFLVKPFEAKTVCIAIDGALAGA